jgi:hypothetical protein
MVALILACCVVPPATSPASARDLKEAKDRTDATIETSSWTGHIETRDGVPHVMNPATPIHPPVAVTLEELWTVGTNSERDEEIFGVIRSLDVDDVGNVYLMDSQLEHIVVFDSNGVYLRTIGRGGEGPGEFRAPKSLFVLSNGDVGVVPMSPSKVICLTPEGVPSGDILLPDLEAAGVRFLFGGSRCGDHFVVFTRVQSLGQGTSQITAALVAYDLDGGELGRIHEFVRTQESAQYTFDEAKSGFFTWAVGTNEKAYVVPKFGDYGIAVRSLDGTPLRVIHREYEHLKRTEEEMRYAMDAFSTSGPIDPKIVVSAHHPDLSRLYPRDDGTLWVLTSRGSRQLPPETLGRFDVYDDEGRYVREVEFVGEGDPVGDRYYFRGNRLFVARHYSDAFDSMAGGKRHGTSTEYEEPEPMKVICYRLPTLDSTD